MLRRRRGQTRWDPVNIKKETTNSSLAQLENNIDEKLGIESDQVENWERLLRIINKIHWDKKKPAQKNDCFQNTDIEHIEGTGFNSLLYPL